MHRRIFQTGAALAALAGLWFAVPTDARPVSDEANFIAQYARDAHGARLVWGERTIVDGSPVATWAILANSDDSILAVGVTFSMKIAAEMPEEGDGPAGSFASLQFPEVVRQTTYFEHFEMHPEPHGHITSPLAVNPLRNSVPHFDFHFYSIPEEDVFAIPAMGPPLPPVPPALLPAGYSPAAPSIAEMGRHSAPFSALADPGFLSADMIAGFLPNGSKMHFIEPMVSQERLLEREDFELDVPMPQSFGRAMLYPTSFQTRFHGNACSMVFSDFTPVQ